MDPVTAVDVQVGPVALTSHPLQRAGAWAVAVLAGREAPEEVSRAELEQVVERLVDGICAAALAPKPSKGERPSPVYEWWKVLFAQYPNSKKPSAYRT